MTTLESYKKFGLEMDGAMGGIWMVTGSAVTLLIILVIILINNLTNKLTGASFDKGIGG